MTLLSNYWTLGSFILTICSAPVWTTIPHWLWSIPVLCYVMTSVKYRRCRYLLGISFAVLLIIAKGNVLQWQAKVLFQAGQNITINAKVDSFFKEISHGFEGTLLIRSINGQSLPTLLQPKVRLIAPISLYSGQEVIASVRIKPVRGRFNEAGFDIESYYMSQEWLAKMSVNSQRSWVIIGNGGIRQTLFERVKEFTKPLPNQGLLLALAFGDKGAISAQQKTQLKQSGLSHLTAISGLHIGIAFFLGYSIGLLVLRLMTRFVLAPFVFGLLMALAYSWLAGFTIPTQRALLMCGVNVILIMSQVNINAMQRILITMSTVLLFSPFAVLASSFWMSFAAVSCVFLYIANQTQPRQLFNFWGSALLLLKNSVNLQVIFLLFLMPVTALVFGGISLSSSLYNLVFVPWVSVCVAPLIFISLLMTLFDSSLLGMCWWLPAWSFEPLSLAISLAEPTWIMVSKSTLILLAIVAVLIMVRSFLTQNVWILAVVISLSGWLSYRDKHGGTWTLDVLDVGHGLAVMIEKDYRVVLYDTGNKWQGGSIAEHIISPILARRGISKIDGMIVSHMDADHAGGLAYIETHLSPDWVRSSEINVSHQPCYQGESWIWNDLTFSALWPPMLVSRPYNPHSCVIRVEDKNGNGVLLAGDINTIGEWMLTRTKETIESQVVIVPHHGSKTSSTQQFIDAVGAQYAVVSVEHGGRWPLPSDLIKQRYIKSGALWLETGLEGQVSFEFYTDSLQLNRLRHNSSNNWYRQMLRNRVE